MKISTSVSAALVLGAWAFQFNLSTAGEVTPGIYIERINDRSRALVPGLKSQYKICADSRQLYRRLYQQGGVGWNAVKQTLPAGYNVSEATAPEPDWEKEGVGRQLEKEYFFGNQHALYQYRMRYEISETDQCALIQHQDLVIDIDDGRQRHLATLKGLKQVQSTPGTGQPPLSLQYESHKVEHMPSPLAIRDKNDQALESINRDERIARLLSLLFSNTEARRVPGVNLSYDPDLVARIKRGLGYEQSNAVSGDMPKANDEHMVAGQACDIISATNLGGRTWYWQRMHHYPGKLERPIILKSEIVNRKGNLVSRKEAISFLVSPEIQASVFVLDAITAPALQAQQGALD